MSECISKRCFVHVSRLIKTEIGFNATNASLAAELTSLPNVRGRGHKVYDSGRKRTHGEYFKTRVSQPARHID